MKKWLPIFLTCTLALPINKEKEIQMLRDYLYEHSPGYSFFFSEIAEPPQKSSWEKLEIEYENVKIWRQKRIDQFFLNSNYMYRKQYVMFLDFVNRYRQSHKIIFMDSPYIGMELMKEAGYELLPIQFMGRRVYVKKLKQSV